MSYKCFAYIIFRTSALSNPTSHSFATSSYHFWIIRKKAVNLQVSEPIEISAATKHSWLKLKDKPCMERNSWIRNRSTSCAFSNTVAANVDVRVCRHLLMILMLNGQWKRRDISRIAEVDSGPAAGMIDGHPRALKYYESWKFDKCGKQQSAVCVSVKVIVHEMWAG